MKKLTIFIFFLVLANISLAQHQLNVIVNGLLPDDEITVIAQQGNKYFFEKELKGSEGDQVSFENIDTGKWSVKLDATSYIYDPAKIVEIPNIAEVVFDINKFYGDDYTYEWKTDKSEAGHAQQSFVNKPIDIVFLGDTIHIPDNFSGLKLARKYGVILSDDHQAWSEESAYIFLSTIGRLPFKEKHWDADITEGYSYIVSLSDDNLQNDIEIEKIGNLSRVLISKRAFTYAYPQTVLIDGLRGNYFSKRLYSATLRMFTDNGNNSLLVSQVAQEKFGIAFLEPGSVLYDLMNEDISNFQEFNSEEKMLILTMLEELPDGMHNQIGLKYMVRRINGQPNPDYPSKAALAWIGKKAIEFMEIAFTGNIEYIQRLILHEKSHFLWHYTFDDDLKDEWATIGEWYEDPSSPSGWSTHNTTNFVSPYAHLLNPNEDMAESIAYYVQDPEKVSSASLDKFNFIRDRIMHGVRYTAIIPDELTFEVYNLYPDYYYPGKITSAKVEVLGAPDEDKIINIELKLHSFDVEKDGASRGFLRFYSLTHTHIDMWLHPKNGTLDSVLVGTTTLSKHAKAGHWILNRINIYDPTNNVRLENASTVGMNLFINNTLEDEVPPVYQANSTNMSPVYEKFKYRSGKPDPDGEAYQSMKIEMAYYDKLPLSRMYASIHFSLADNSTESPFSHDVQNDVNPNEYNSIKNGEVYFPIPEYYPTGTYSIVYSLAQDIAKNKSRCYYVSDTSQFDNNDFDKFEDIRKTFNVVTSSPDLLDPLLKLNAIEIKASPINPSAPDGETLVELQLIIKDTSDYTGLASGLREINYVLKDPQGGEHEFNGYNDLNEIAHNFFHLLKSPITPGEWRVYNLSTILPKGSAPGKWGLSSVQIADRANNVNNYSFVEIVQFDLIETEYEFTVAPFANINDINHVNADNVENSNLNLGCSPCDEINFSYYIYSEYGGEVLTGNGLIIDDSGLVQNLNLSDYPDGKLKLRVEYSDQQNQLIGVVTEEVTKDVTVNIYDHKAIGKINVYPNPTTGSVSLSFDEIHNGRFELINLYGEIINAGKLTNCENTSIEINAKPGVYILKVEDVNKHLTCFKIINQ